jgi:hypothetical protein
MLSNRSGSSASPDVPSTPAALVRHGWPTLIVLPVLVAILYVAPFTPMIQMFFGEDFGLSGGREAPWPWAPVLIILLSFWATTLLDMTRLSQEVMSTILAILAIPVVLAWWALEPAWDVAPVLRNPISLVNESGYLFLPLMIGLGCWVLGIRMANGRDALSPEVLRQATRNSLVGLVLVMMLAGMVGGDLGDEGMSAAFLALPLQLVSSAGAIAAAEMANTRRIAAQNRIAAPGWDRWARVFGGTAAILLVMTGIGALLVGPGALDALVSGFAAAWNVIATIIYWIVYGIVFVIFYIIRFIAWIINSIFGDVFAPMEMPEIAPGGAGEFEGAAEEEEVQPWRYATLVRWIVLMAIIWLVALLIIWISKRRSVEADGVDLEEERTSVFSAALARKQLRDLFRRKPKPTPPRRLDLDRDPESVRESMLYLQVLAARQEVPREPFETPQDFTARLANTWPGVEPHLAVIRDRYEHVRYGETEDDRRAVIDAWRGIWSARKDVALPAS